jgi:hypothetical protein
MKTAESGPRPYRAVMTELADATREARAAADVMDFFAGQLRGDPADLDGPELTALPSRSAVLRMLRRIDDALSPAGPPAGLALSRRGKMRKSRPFASP